MKNEEEELGFDNFAIWLFGNLPFSSRWPVCGEQWAVGYEL
jgi:hypothetical protein